MSGGVFRVRWRRDKRRPVSIGGGGLVSIGIAALNRRYWTPEVVSILRVPAGDACVSRSKIHERKGSGGRRQVEVARCEDLVQCGVPNRGRRSPPEESDLRLFVCPC